MWLDALLAYLHYISIFTLIVFLTAEAVVLRPKSANAWHAMTPSSASQRWRC